MTTQTTEATGRVGAVRAAQRLTERLGRPIATEELRALADVGALVEAGQWRGNALFDVDDVDVLDVDQIDAALASPDRLLTREQAAQHLQVRAVDVKHLVGTGLLTPDQSRTVTLHHVSSTTTGMVDLFRAGQLDALACRPDLDAQWRAARAAPAGAPSPFRRRGSGTRTRSQAVREAAQQLADLWCVEVWSAYRAGQGGGWTITADTSTGALTADEAAHAIRSHPLLGEHATARGVLAGAPELDAVVASRANLRRGTAVILDTETTGLEGYLVEIAVIDAATGATLLDTFVQPGCEVEPEARAVHGISDAQLADAPTFAEVLPRLVDAVGQSTILAYNSAFDRNVLRRHARRDGLRLGALAEAERWDCLMNRLSDYLSADGWLALGGGHRALGDCRAALEVLRDMTTPPRTPTSPTIRSHQPRTLAEAAQNH